MTLVEFIKNGKSQISYPNAISVGYYGQELKNVENQLLSVDIFRNKEINILDASSYHIQIKDQIIWKKCDTIIIDTNDIILTDKNYWNDEIWIYSVLYIENYSHVRKNIVQLQIVKDSLLSYSQYIDKKIQNVLC